MAPRFIGKTSLAGLHPVALDGTPVLGQHERLRGAVQARAGAGAAALFAEPVITWPSGDAPGSVSWYADLPGDAEPLASLPPDRRAVPDARLRTILASLQPLLGDAEVGPLLRRALALRSPGSIMASSGAPLLLDWGLVEEGGSEEEQLARATAWTAPYMPRAAPPPPVVAPAAPLPAAASAALPLRPALPGGTGRGAWDWALVPAAVVTAALFLGVGVWAGARMVAARVAERPTTVPLLNEQAAREAIDRQREQNAALEREIEARRRTLSGNVCVADPAQVPRAGPDRAAVVPPSAVVPPPPGGQAFQGSLAELLTQAVVLIIAPASRTDDGTSTASGFFVAPDLIATNWHVIEGADPSAIMVTSKKLGRTTRAQLVARTPNSEIGSPDIALLRVAGVTGIQPLAFSTTAAPLDQVIAAGFPGLLMQSDAAFERLRNGDASAVPEVILTDGRINAIQSAPTGMRIIPHSAAVSGGNSGGPLADACGRVIGINTFITANREQVVHANYAQKSDGVIEFIRQNGANVQDVTVACTPGGPPAAPAPAAPAPAPPPPVTPPATPAPAAPAR